MGVQCQFHGAKLRSSLGIEVAEAKGGGGLQASLSSLLAHAGSARYVHRNARSGCARLFPQASLHVSVSSRRGGLFRLNASACTGLLTLSALRHMTGSCASTGCMCALACAFEQGSRRQILGTGFDTLDARRNIADAPAGTAAHRPPDDTAILLPPDVLVSRTRRCGDVHRVTWRASSCNVAAKFLARSTWFVFGRIWVNAIYVPMSHVLSHLHFPLKLRLDGHEGRG